MRKTSSQKGEAIPLELTDVYKRLEINAKAFGMPDCELDQIKKAYQVALKHKKILDKIAKKKGG